MNKQLSYFQIDNTNHLNDKRPKEYIFQKISQKWIGS